MISMSKRNAAVGLAYSYTLVVLVLHLMHPKVPEPSTQDYSLSVLTKWRSTTGVYSSR